MIFKFNIKLGKKYLFFKLYSHQVHGMINCWFIWRLQWPRPSVPLPWCRHPHSALASPFSAGAAFFALAAFFGAAFLGFGAGLAGWGLADNLAERLEGSPLAPSVGFLGMLISFGIEAQNKK